MEVPDLNRDGLSDIALFYRGQGNVLDKVYLLLSKREELVGKKNEE